MFFYTKLFGHLLALPLVDVGEENFLFFDGHGVEGVLSAGHRRVSAHLLAPRLDVDVAGCVVGQLRGVAFLLRPRGADAVVLGLVSEVYSSAHLVVCLGLSLGHLVLQDGLDVLEGGAEGLLHAGRVGLRGNRFYSCCALDVLAAGHISVLWNNSRLLPGIQINTARRMPLQLLEVRLSLLGREGVAHPREFVVALAQTDEGGHGAVERVRCANLLLLLGGFAINFHV